MDNNKKSNTHFVIILIVTILIILFIITIAYFFFIKENNSNLVTNSSIKNDSNTINIDEKTQNIVNYNTISNLENITLNEINNTEITTNTISDNSIYYEDMYFNNTEEKHTLIDSNTGLRLGDYTVSEPTLDEVGITNEDCGIKLKDDNKFQAYMGFGAWHNGSFEIKDNLLICNSVELGWDGGAGPGSRPTDVVFTYKIVNSNLLELIDIKINDSDSEKLIYEHALTIGMKYSVK